jgi:hypothetical protein
MDNRNVQYDILITELTLEQQQIDKFDGLSMKIKTWAASAWAIAIGWSFQSERKEIILLAIILVLSLWMFDALYKMFRRDHKNRRNEIATVLQKVFETQTIPQGVVAPQFPTHRRSAAAREFVKLHLALPYLLLVVIAVILFVSF